MPLILFISEIILAYVLTAQYGFWIVLGLYFIPSILGMALFSRMAQNSLSELQGQLNAGKEPTSLMMKEGLKWVAVIMLIIPSLLTHFLGFLLFVPFVKTLLVFIFQGFLFKFLFSRFGTVINFSQNFNPHNFNGSNGKNTKNINLDGNFRDSKSKDDVIDVEFKDLTKKDE